jgi:hypothetical protein
MTSDLDIGFRSEPVGLDDFLAERGYVYSPDLQNGEEKVYSNRKSKGPVLCYDSKFNLSRDRNWARAGYKISSCLNINFHNGKERVSAEGLAEKLVRRYGAVCYDPSHEFFYDQVALAGSFE